jgi:hypothetical protein
LVVEALQVLDIDRGEDIDSHLQHIAYVLVALLVLDAGDIGVRELVDQTELRLAREHRRQVHLLEWFASVKNPSARNDLETLRLGYRLVASVRLQIADRHVAPTVGFSCALLQHPIGLANAGRHTDEDLQASSFVGHTRIVLDRSAERTASAGTDGRPPRATSSPCA